LVIVIGEGSTAIWAEWQKNNSQFMPNKFTLVMCIFALFMMLLYKSISCVCYYKYRQRLLMMKKKRTTLNIRCDTSVPVYIRPRA
jgi:hypothetical protein